MDFRYSTEQELFRQSMREWVAKNLEPRAREIDNGEIGIPKEVLSGLVDLGVFGMSIPEEYGGNAVPGEESIYSMIAIQEIARGDLSMSTSVYTLLTAGWAYIINRFGTRQLKEEVLPRVARGEIFIGASLTEPGGGSDLANIKTRATNKSGTYVVNGEKAYISGVKECERLGWPSGHCTLVSTDPDKGHRGQTYLFVPANSPGMSYSVYDDMGRMGLSTGGVVYKDVEVPAYCLLGEEGRGFYHLMQSFNFGRLLVVAACTGAIERGLEISAEYCKQRHTFGRPLIKNEAISFEMVNDWMQFDLLKLNVQRAAWMIAYESQNPGSISHKDINKTVATCKCLAPALGHDVARHGMIYHGAFGYTKETPLEMMLRGIMSYEVGAEGGLNVMRGIIARDLWGDVASPFKS